MESKNKLNRQNSKDSGCIADMEYVITYLFICFFVLFFD